MSNTTTTAKDLENFFLVRQGMSDEEQLEFYKTLEPKSFDDKSLVVKCNQSDENGMYIITEGHAFVKDAEGNVINELNAGDYFGELALLMNDKRSTTIEADGHMETLHIPKDVYMALIEQNPRNQGYLFANLYTKLSDRYQQLVELTNLQKRYLQMIKFLPILLITMVIARQIAAIPASTFSLTAGAVFTFIAFIAAMLIAKISLSDLGLAKGSGFSVVDMLIGAIGSFLLLGTPTFAGGIIFSNATLSLQLIVNTVSAVMASMYIGVMFLLFLPSALRVIMNKMDGIIKPAIIPALVIAISTSRPLLMSSINSGSQNLIHVIIAIIIIGAVSFGLCCLRLKRTSTIGLSTGYIIGAIAIPVLRLFVFPI